MYATGDSSMNEQPMSKVLVLDNSPEHAPLIKSFCDQNNLYALKVRKDCITSVLRTNIDLGGILYSETYGDSLEETTRIALDIHAARPELPIIVRRGERATLAGLPERAQRVFCAAYVSSDMSALRQVIDQYIFCLVYPNALLRGIAEISTEVFANTFKSVKPSFDTPYIVHDRIIFGEVFSLIALESSWCRGYMMLQVEEDPFLRLMDEACKEGKAENFRHVNDRLSEITNMIWGGFKNRYIGDSRSSAAARVQVPMMVNHKRNYMSFGTSNPQLCFRFNLENEVTGTVSTLYERFVFNLNWSPEDFQEIVQETGSLVASGAIELF
jgi:CheY-specific phosphatase CheX